MQFDWMAYWFDAVRFARERLDFHPDAMQARVLDLSIHRGILNCTRQWGKSTVCAVLGVHRALSRPGSLVVIASPTERQSAELVRKMEGFLRKAGIKPRGDGDNKISVLLPNGSRIVGLPGAEVNIRGFSAASLVLIDEAAGVSDEVYRAVRPMLAVGGADGTAGDMWLLSTPRGKEGFFYREWMDGNAKWTRIAVPATECPRISAKFLEEEHASLGDPWFGREYLCEFVQDEDHFFRESDVAACVTDEVDPLAEE